MVPKGKEIPFQEIPCSSKLVETVKANSWGRDWKLMKEGREEFLPKATVIIRERLELSVQLCSQPYGAATVISI